MRALLVALMMLTLAVLAPDAAQAALEPGQLDPGFGSGGLLSFEPSLAAPKRSYLESTAIDASGRILVAGAASDAGGHEAVLVGRLLPDGTPDVTFGSGGFVVRQVGQGTSEDGPDSFATFVGPAPDGGVLVGLERNRTDNFQDVDAMKLDSAGNVDYNYGGSGTGLASLSLGSGYYLFTQSNSGAIGPDGSLFLVAQLGPTTGTTPHSLAWLDFSPTGNATEVSTQLSDTGGTLPNAIVRLPSGEFLVGGIVARATGGEQSFVARLQANGQLDTTYGGITNTGGTAVPGATLMQFGAGSTPTTTTASLVNGPDGAAYGTADASTGVSNSTQMVVTRYGASGQLDSGFGPSGTRRLSLGQCTGPSYCGTAAGPVLVDPSGRVLALATVYDGTEHPQVELARYEPDGTLDASFGAGGIAGPYSAEVSAMSFGADNRLLMAGSTDRTPLEAQLIRVALEHIADPPSTPTPTPITPTSPPVITSGAPSAPPSDKTAPKLSALKVVVAAKTDRGSLTLQSSEAGRLTVAVQRARSGHRHKGKCSTSTKHGGNCTLYVNVTSVSAPLQAGKVTIALGRTRLAPGSYRAVLVATDSAGNRATPVTVTFHVASPGH
jgi:uncharacterized delta-60 repeat protein